MTHDAFAKAKEILIGIRKRDVTKPTAHYPVMLAEVKSNGMVITPSRQAWTLAALREATAGPDDVRMYIGPVVDLDNAVVVVVWEAGRTEARRFFTTTGEDVPFDLAKPHG